MTDHYWLHKRLWSSKWCSAIIQHASPHKLASKWTSAVSEGSERGMSQNKEGRMGCRAVGRGEGCVITSTILNPLFPSHFFLSSSCFGTNGFIRHIGWGVQSTGWLLKVVYRGWPCLTFGTIECGAIHQRSREPLRGSARYKPSLGIKLWGEMSQSPLDKWVKSLELINVKQKNDTHMHSERAYQGPPYTQMQIHGNFMMNIQL